MTENFTDLAVTIAMFNSGASLATNVIFTEPYVVIDTDPGVSEQIQKCSFTYPKVSGEYLSPSNQVRSFGMSTGTKASRFIGDAERRYIMDRREHVLIFGGIKYSGIRGGDFETKYCYIWNPENVKDPNSLPWSGCTCSHIQ